MSPRAQLVMSCNSKDFERLKNSQLVTPAKEVVFSSILALFVSRITQNYSSGFTKFGGKRNRQILVVAVFFLLTKMKIRR